jgi:HD-like signal output (HDOD) protein
MMSRGSPDTEAPMIGARAAARWPFPDFLTRARRDHTRALSGASRAM